MEIVGAIQDCEVLQKKLVKIVKCLKQIAPLDDCREANSLQIIKLLGTLKSELPESKSGVEFLDELRCWYLAYLEDVNRAKADFGSAFGRELSRQFHESGLIMKGHFPEWTVSFSTIQVCMTKRQQVSIWYGPKEERLDTCDPEPRTVVHRVKECLAKLGSGLKEEDLLGRLREAYLRATQNELNKPVPLTQVLGELAPIVRPQPKNEINRKRAQRVYGRADLSFDLYRLRARYSNKLHLTVAVRSDTGSRSGFVWVPSSDDMAGGQRYSKIKFCQ